MTQPTLVTFGPWISHNAFQPTTASGLTIGTINGVAGPCANFTVQTNYTGVFSGTVNVQLIGSLDNVTFFPLASGLGSGLNFVALNGPVFWVGTQTTYASGAGNTSSTLTTWIWSK